MATKRLAPTFVFRPPIAQHSFPNPVKMMPLAKELPPNTFRLKVLGGSVLAKWPQNAWPKPRTPTPDSPTFVSKPNKNDASGQRTAPHYISIKSVGEKRLGQRATKYPTLQSQISSIDWFFMAYDLHKLWATQSKPIIFYRTMVEHCISIETHYPRRRPPPLLLSLIHAHQNLRSNLQSVRTHRNHTSQAHYLFRRWPSILIQIWDSMICLLRQKLATR